ncbi:hypothetical protein KI387_004137, partial [Taxus chinensis]
VCTDTRMLPMEKTRAVLSMDAGEASAAGRHINVFTPVWHMDKMVTSLCTELAGYRNAEHMMKSCSHSEATAT